jgi:hypothetical protein
VNERDMTVGSRKSGSSKSTRRGVAWHVPMKRGDAGDNEHEWLARTHPASGLGYLSAKRHAF